MKNLFVALTAIAVLFIVGCKDNTTNPSSTVDAQSLSKASVQGTEDRAGGSGRTENRLEGRVNDVDPRAGTVTIGRIVVQTDNQTKVERNGFHATLSQFKVGDRGQARWNAGASVANKVEAKGL